MKSPRVIIGLFCLSIVVAVASGPVRAEKKTRRPEPFAPGGDATIRSNTPVESTTIPGGQEHPLREPLRLAAKSRQALNGVRDYSATFSKRELLGKKLTRQVMDAKIRHEPFSVYFRFRDPEPGREVIFVKGANRDRLLIHEEGFKAIAGTLALGMNDPQVTKENRYPITMVGMAALLETIASQWEEETKYGDVTVKFYEQAKLGDVDCLVVESSHAQQRKEFRFQMTRLYFDKESFLPIRAEQYGWPKKSGEQPPLVEEYTYSNIRLNPGLSDRDFDTRNPEYRYR
jgi:outer membrane lipoprotein-sorting protein